MDQVGFVHVFFACVFRKGLPFGRRFWNKQNHHNNNGYRNPVYPENSLLYDFPDYCQQALAAIRIGQKINYTERFYLFQEYALDYIIYEGWDTLPFNVALFGPLKNLIDYDKANKAHYCETLKMFFHHNMKMSQTADALGIHISTLKYRINRIRGLLDLDFDQFTSRLYLQLVMDLLK